MTSHTDDAVFQASFAGLRAVNTRKVLQIILEVPIEENILVLSVLGGFPHPGETVWVACARIKTPGI